MLGINSGVPQRRGGPEHQYWIRALAERFKDRGYEVAEEVPIGAGKTVDLVAAADGKCIACEVETGASDVEANIQKCRGAGFDRIIVAFTSQKAMERFARCSPVLKSVHLVTTAELCSPEY